MSLENQITLGLIMIAIFVLLFAVVEGSDYA